MNKTHDTKHGMHAAQSFFFGFSVPPRGACAWDVSADAALSSDCFVSCLPAVPLLFVVAAPTNCRAYLFENTWHWIGLTGSSQGRDRIACVRSYIRWLAFVVLCTKVGASQCTVFFRTIVDQLPTHAPRCSNWHRCRHSCSSRIRSLLRAPNQTYPTPKKDFKLRTGTSPGASLQPVTKTSVERTDRGEIVVVAEQRRDHGDDSVRKLGSHENPFGFPLVRVEGFVSSKDAGLPKPDVTNAKGGIKNGKKRRKSATQSKVFSLIFNLVSV